MYTAYIDLDGTLLDDNKRISANTYNILSDFMGHGNNIVITTARSKRLNGLQNEVRLLTPYFIFHNGGELVSSGKILKRYFFTSSDIRRIGSFLSENGIRGALVTDDEYFANYNAPLVWGNISNFHFTDFSDVRISAPKFSVIIDSDEQISVLNKIEKDIQITYIDNGTGAIIAPENVNKGLAVSYMQNYLFTSSRSIYFGNDFNDLYGFNVCDIKVAVENAEPEIKEQADYITNSNNREGVACFLQKLMDDEYKLK